MRLRWVLFTMLAATACAAPSATDLVVPQDGVHVAGAAKMFFPASPAGQCQSRQYTGAAGKSVTMLSYNFQAGAPVGSGKFISFSITGYHGAGTYSIDKVPTATAAPRSPDQFVSLYSGTTGGAWIADGGTITVIATGGTMRGTVNVQKTWAKGPPTTANATIQGTWACTVQSTPSPVMIGG